MAKSNGGLWWVRWCMLGSIAISIFLLVFAIFLIIIGFTTNFLIVIALLLAWHITFAHMMRNIDKGTDREIVFKLRWLAWRKR